MDWLSRLYEDELVQTVFLILKTGSPPVDEDHLVLRTDFSRYFCNRRDFRCLLREREQPVRLGDLHGNEGEVPRVLNMDGS